MAVFCIFGALSTLSYGQVVQWPLFAFWQGLAGLLTALCGKCLLFWKFENVFIDFANFHKTIFSHFTGLISNGFWPSWTFDLWWIPVLTAIFGTLANLLIVKLVLKQQYSSAAIICAKISLEALVLFVSIEGVDLSPTNLVALVFLLSRFRLEGFFFCNF